MVAVVVVVVVVVVDVVDVVVVVDVLDGAGPGGDGNVVVVLPPMGGGSGGAAGTTSTGRTARPTSARVPITPLIMPEDRRQVAACHPCPPVTLGCALCCPSSSMEEQRTFNPLVQGSSPWGGTSLPPALSVHPGDVRPGGRTRGTNAGTNAALTGP